MTREEEIQIAAEEYSAYIDATDEDRYNSTELEAFKDGAEWADAHPAKKQAVTIEAWVARNWTGLYLCESMPKPQKSYSDDYDLGNHIRIGNKNILKDVKGIEDGGKPKKVKVTIELENE